MLKQFYRWLHKITSKPEEAHEYSRGYWQDKVRGLALELCRAKSGRFLEIGCGEGLFLTKLGFSNPNIEIWGIDNKLDLLNRAKKKAEDTGLDSTKLLYGDATNLEFEDFFFDTVVCINVLFNMASKESIKKSLKEMGRVCKKEGRIIFDFRNAKNLLLSLKYKLAPYYDSSVKNLPLTTCRVDEIEPVLNEMNFQIIRRFDVCFPKGKFTPIILFEAKKLR